MKRECDYEGCTKGIATGHALHRVSPKGPGQEFVGMCDEHYAGRPDPVAMVFQRDNHAGSRCPHDECPPYGCMKEGRFDAG